MEGVVIDDRVEDVSSSSPSPPTLILLLGFIFICRLLLVVVNSRLQQLFAVNVVVLARISLQLLLSYFHLVLDLFVGSL